MTIAALDAAEDDRATPWRTLIVLGLASFASSAALRFCDPLLPKIADAFGVTVGATAIIVTMYAVSYGLFQLVTGPLGDRFGKVRVIAAGSTLCGVLTVASAFTTNITELATLRFLAGLAGAAVIPNCLAFIGDAVPLARRQAVLARYMISMSLGTISGQAIGGVIADVGGWQAVFVMIGAFLILAGLALLIRSPFDPLMAAPPAGRAVGVFAAASRLAALRRNPQARLVLLAVTLEAALFYGAFTFVGAHLRSAFALSYAAIGAITATIAIGAISYGVVAPWAIARFGEKTLVGASAAFFAVSFLIIATSPSVAGIILGCVLAGVGFVLLHNSLQKNATQLDPDARGASISAFAFAFFLGQTLGVGFASPIYDLFGAVPLFLGAAALLPLLAFWFRRGLGAA